MSSQYEESLVRSSISSKDIDIALRKIRNHFSGKISMSNFQLNNELVGLTKKRLEYFNSNEIIDFELQSELQKIANTIARHLLITRQIKVIVYKRLDNNSTFENIDNELFCIKISNDLQNQTIAQKITLITQGLLTYKLPDSNGLFSKIIEFDKDMTRALYGIYAGVGFLFLNRNTVNEKFLRKEDNSGYQNIINSVKSPSDWFVSRAIAKTALLRKQNPIWIIQNSPIKYFPYYVFKFLNLIFKYYKVKLGRKNKAKNSKIYGFTNSNFSNQKGKIDIEDTLELDKNRLMRNEINLLLRGTKSSCNDFEVLYRRKYQHLNEEDVLDKILYDLKRDMR